MPLLPLFALFAALSACADEDPVAQPPLLPDPWASSDWSLTVTADRATAPVGEAVAFQVVLVDPLGVDVTLDYDIRTFLSPAVGVLADGDGLYRFTKAQPYTYFAEVDLLGHTLVDAVDVEITAGPPASLRIWPELPLLEAGDSMLVHSAVEDQYGNAVEAELSFDSAPSAEWHDAEISPTESGPYVVTGQIVGTSITDDATFTVLPSVPVSLDISLSSYDVEKGQGVIVTSVMLDAFGNAVTDVPVDLVTDPSDGTAAWADFVRFEDEGIYIVEASVLEWGLSAADGPVLVDSTGPAIRVVTPARGAEIDQDLGPTVTVTGSVTDAWTGVTALSINGQAQSLGAGGLFTLALNPEFGLNTIEIVATDGDGNTSDHVQTFLWGDFLPMGDENPDGILARLNEEAIDTIEDFAESFFDPQALVAGIINQPLWSNSQQTCINIWPFGNQCVTWWSLNAGVTGVTLGDIEIDLDAQSGYLDFFASISPFSVSIGLWGEILFIGDVNVGGTASANAAEIWSDVSLWVDSNHDIQVALSNTDVALPGFNLSIYGAGFVGDLLSAVLGWLSPLLQVAFEAVLPPVIESQLPGLVADALGDLAIATDLDLMGATIGLEALPQVITIDPNGMTVTLTTIVEATLAGTVPPSLGAVRRTAYGTPSFAPTPAFDISMADNFINQLLHSVWQGGVMNFSLAGADLGLDLSQVSSIVPISEISLQTLPLLPPVVGPAASGQLELALGDMLVNVYGDPGGVNGLMMQLAVSLTTDATLSIDADETIQFSVGTPVVRMEYVTSDWAEVDGEIVEDLMDSVIELVIPMLMDTLSGIGGIPIPELPGFALDNPGIWREPAPAYYVTAGGDLTVLP